MRVMVQSLSRHGSGTSAAGAQVYPAMLYPCLEPYSMWGNPHWKPAGAAMCSSVCFVICGAKVHCLSLKCISVIPQAAAHDPHLMLTKINLLI